LIGAVKQSHNAAQPITKQKRGQHR